MRKNLTALLCIILLSVLVIAMVSPAQATESINPIYANEQYVYEIVPSGLVRILRYIGDEKNLRIPEKIDGIEVVTLDKYSFMGSDIVSVTLPSTLGSVMTDAFYDCQSLREVTIPEGIKFYENAFRNCRNLTTVNFDENVTSLGTAMFYGCISLERIALPDRIKKIPEEAFAYCTNLKHVAFPDSLTEIGKNAFTHTPLDINDEGNTLPKSLKTIGPLAFSHNSAIENLRIPEGIEIIEMYAFSHCEKLQTIHIPSSVTRIEFFAFAYNKNLSDVIIPNPNPMLVVEDNVLQNTPLEDKHFSVFPQTKTYYFYMPDHWRIFSSINACWKESPESSAYLYYSAAKTTTTRGVLVCKVPAHIDEIIFNTTTPRVDKNGKPVVNDSYNKTAPINLDGYKSGENATYPDGLEDFDGMIYVLDDYEAQQNRRNARGEWYYYYIDGYYGTTPEPDWWGDTLLSGSTTGKPYVPPTETLPTDPVSPTDTEVPQDTYPCYPPTFTVPNETEGVDSPPWNPTENPPAPTEPVATESAPCVTVPAETTPVCTSPIETTPTEPIVPGGTQSGTADESTDSPTTSDTDFEQKEKVHRANAYNALRKNMETWASLGWDVRIRGDVNGDLTVNVKDATLIQKHLAGISVQNILLKNADVNTDGSVNIRDATLIQKKVAGLVSSFD